jgi:hypothetical protein
MDQKFFFDRGAFAREHFDLHKEQRAVILFFACRGVVRHLVQ